ncbi:MAG: hypothetical protein RMK00_05315 [Bacteroidota bacterium]|nr:hypothetical protein [Candidatus Kapabacteria bacterium]MCS7302709.1 hypothetical protein [Candidatus Kapabacteria bacterium]MCX7937074.1 hypothetical protein [Chlorobiota bacterium]MDW8075173.1 hypothetical protein [Bacteroidota bacterium]
MELTPEALGNYDRHQKDLSASVEHLVGLEPHPLSLFRQVWCCSRLQTQAARCSPLPLGHVEQRYWRHA